MIQLIGVGILAAILFFGQKNIYQKLWNRHLSVDIAFGSESIFEGEQGQLREQVENRKRLPLSMLKVKFTTSRNLLFAVEEGSRTTDKYYRNDVFQINGGERVTRTLQFTGGRRGYYCIDSIDLVASDLLMTTEMTDTLYLKRNLYVYPRIYDTREFRLSLQQLSGEILTKRHLLEDPFEYRGIREYQPSDDMRSINWKATARTGELKVNQRNYTALESVRIFLNTEENKVFRKAECVEAGIQIVAGLCDFFLRQGFRVACYTNSVDIITGEPFLMETNAGLCQMEGIYRGLSRLDTDSEPAHFTELFEQKLMGGVKSIFTCFVCDGQSEDFVKLVERFQAEGQDYLWYYPVWESKEPSLPQDLREHIRVMHVRG